ncbi:hypothetical protein ACFLS0_05625 [Candidatus Bipolaricaulota bacterium]
MNRLDRQKELKMLDSFGMLRTFDVFPPQHGSAIRLRGESEWKPTIDVIDPKPVALDPKPVALIEEFKTALARRLSQLGGEE